MAAQRLPAQASLADERVPLAPDLVVWRSLSGANPVELVEYFAAEGR